MDFLADKSRRLAALDRLLAVGPALDAAAAPAITKRETQAEVDAVRARPAREAIASVDLSDAELALIQAAEIPAEQRYDLDR